MGAVDMNILNRKGVKANGKIVICDFKTLDPSDFLPLHNLHKSELIKELMLIAPDGKIYINYKIDGSQYVAGIFETIMQESQYTLDQYCKAFKPKYKKITFENIANMKGTNEEITQAFALLCIPIEVKRRRIERNYYSKIKPIF